MKICSQCDTSFNETYNFCPICGKEVEREIRCPHCSTIVEYTNANYCTNCGKKIINYTPEGNDKDFTKKEQVRKNDVATNLFVDLPEYYRKEFIALHESNGKYNGKFNWAAFFFGVLWALSKCLFLNALAGFSIGFIISIALPPIGPVICIIISVIYGCNGNRWYYNNYMKSKADNNAQSVE